MIDPIAGADNADAIALRAAISILQLQRERAQADLIALERLKAQAVNEADAFVQELLDGRLAKETNNVAPSGSTLSIGPDDAGRRRPPHDRGLVPPPSRFAPIPIPQNVVRCPPINWDKYHVVGESLDKIHAEQTQRPHYGAPAEAGVRAPRTVLAAPYSPFTDKISNLARQEEENEKS
ncbi:MAG: hypothetical protein M1826_005325 [Phylliscum demangeonii]|nr:MAG: hypothetical protein M1826_005325 [Phylliscum demangeonii]